MDEPRDAAGPLRLRPAAVLLVALAPLAARAAAGSGPAGSQRPAPPTLVIAIVVDQMRGDYLQRFGPQLTGGLRRLAREGAVFTHAYQDHAMTETAPGHATLLSGRYPASTGIARNDEGVGDSAMRLVEAPGPGASPARFQGTQLFDWMQQRWPAARALSVSRKDRSAILMVGRARQVVYWYSAGRFTTSRYYADSLPAWLRDFNRQALAVRAGTAEWPLLRDPSAYTEPDSMPYEHHGRSIAFPHRFPDDSAGRASAFSDSPYIDSLTLALALEGLQRMDLGHGPGPDLLAIGLSQTDYVGHGWGPDSRELHDQILRLDRWIGAFLDSLGRVRDLRRVVLVLSADHGVTPYPEWSQTHGNTEATYPRVDTVLARWRDSLNARWGRANWIRYFDYGMLALNRPGLAAAGADVDSIVASMRRDLERVPGVQRVYTRAMIASPDTTGDWVRVWWHRTVPASSQAELFVALGPGDVFGPGRGSAEHGLATDTDAWVTLAFWGAPFRAGHYAGRVSTVDVAPTLARAIGVTPDSAVQGRVLREALK